MMINAVSHILMFDIDETLADSGAPLSARTCDVLDYLQNIDGYQISFATSRSYSELESRIPKNILEQAYAFTCMGMEFWHQNTLYTQHNFNWPLSLKEAIDALIKICDCPFKTGQHIIIRPSKGAFTPLGEGATSQQRTNFIAWDQKTDFLNSACSYLRTQFPSVYFKVFGKTSIDFSDKIMSKEVALIELRQIDKRSVVFFGDSLQKGGNDNALANALHVENCQNTSHRNKAIQVKNPDDTLTRLYNLKNKNLV